MAKDAAITANLFALTLEYNYESAAQVHKVAAILSRMAAAAAQCPPDVLLALDTVFLTGMRQYPETALLHTLQSAFRWDLLREGGVPGQSTLERARSLNPTFEQARRAQLPSRNADRTPLFASRA